MGLVTRRSLRRLTCGALLLALLARAAPAAADRSIVAAPLLPASDSYGLYVTERAQGPGRFEPGAAVVVGYAYAPLVPRFSSGERALITHQATVDLALSLGLLDFLSVSTVLPVVAQWFEEDLLGRVAVTPSGVYRGQPRQNNSLEGSGPRDPRVALKARLWQGQRLRVGLLLAGTIPVGNSDAFAGDQDGTLRPAVLLDSTLGPVSLLGNLGAIVRRRSELRDPTAAAPASAPVLLAVASELSWSLGVAVRPLPLLGLSLEGFGTLALEQEGTYNRSELLGAVSLYPTRARDLRVGAAVGGGLAPDDPMRTPLRVLLGVLWAPLPRRGGLP